MSTYDKVDNGLLCQDSIQSGRVVSIKRGVFSNARLSVIRSLRKTLQDPALFIVMLLAYSQLSCK